MGGSRLSGPGKDEERDEELRPEREELGTRKRTWGVWEEIGHHSIS